MYGTINKDEARYKIVSGAFEYGYTHKGYIQLSFLGLKYWKLIDKSVSLEQCERWLKDKTEKYRSKPIPSETYYYKDN